MPILFDLPPDPPSHVIEHACNTVYREFVSQNKAVLSSEEAKLAREVAQLEDDKESKSNLRRKSILAQSKKMGSLAAYDWRLNDIERRIQPIEPALDVIFDFRKLMTADNILYPRISRAERAIVLTEDGKTARKSQYSMRIESPARIVYDAPTWRAYLKQPREPFKIEVRLGIAAQNEDEYKLWKEGLCTGFKEGIRQANLVFNDRLTKLVSDYEKMMNYRLLLEQGIVNEPRIEESRLGINVSSDRSEVHVEDTVIRITEDAGFVLDVENWKPVESLPLGREE
jgi:defect-in-organelle-trafficking protein DotC